MPLSPTPEERRRFEEQQRQWREAQEELKRRAMYVDLSNYYLEATRNMGTVEPSNNPLFEGALSDELLARIMRNSNSAWEKGDYDKSASGPIVRQQALDAWRPPEARIDHGFRISPDVEIADPLPPGEYETYYPSGGKDGLRSTTMQVPDGSEYEMYKASNSIRPELWPQEAEFSELTGWPGRANAESGAWEEATRSPHVVARKNPDGSIDMTPKGDWLPDEYFDEGNFEWNRYEIPYLGDIQSWAPWPWSDPALTPIIVRKQGRRQD